MFNKSSVFNRNDPAPARATTPENGTARGGIPVLDSNRTAAATPAKTGNPVTPAPASPTTAPAEPAVAREAAGGEIAMGARLIVGPEVKLRGAEILDCDTLVVEGRVEATMDSRVIRIAENGSFAGKVSIDIAEIHGTFEGELTARLQLIIHSTGRVSGTIRYGKLVADEGCQLCGDINLLSHGDNTKAKPAAAPMAPVSVVAG